MTTLAKEQCEALSVIEAWRMRYQRAGLLPIPLTPDRKDPPMCAAWQLTPVATQWSEVAAGGPFRGNIGLLAGHGFAVVDCDSPEAEDRVLAGLPKLRDGPVTVRTASGGLHVYLRVQGVPTGLNWCHLSPEVGRGELRCRNAYVVAPCSRVQGADYRFGQGGPETLARQRALRWRELSWLVATDAAVAHPSLEAPPIPLLTRGMPERAEALLEGLRNAPRRPPFTYAYAGAVLSYPSRSEGEAAVVALLVLAGWEYAEIQGVFGRYRPGHYMEIGAHRERYLQRTYRKVVGWLSDTPERCAICATYRQAGQVPWPGAGGGLERDVYRGLLAIGWVGNAWCLYASVRDLALYTGASYAAVGRALVRLQRGGLVREVRSLAESSEVPHSAREWEVRDLSDQRPYTYHNLTPDGGPTHQRGTEG